MPRLMTAGRVVRGDHLAVIIHGDAERCGRAGDIVDAGSEASVHLTRGFDVGELPVLPASVETPTLPSWPSAATHSEREGRDRPKKSEVELSDCRGPSSGWPRPVGESSKLSVLKEPRVATQKVRDAHELRSGYRAGVSLLSKECRSRSVKFHAGAELSGVVEAAT